MTEDIITAINRELHQRTRAVMSAERQNLGIYFSPEGLKKFKAHPGVKSVVEEYPNSTRLLGMKVYLNEDQKEDFIIKRG